jgi:hypothetical protein
LCHQSRSASCGTRTAPGRTSLTSAPAIPFALLQGHIFSRTKALTYVVCVNLLCDLVVFRVHAHNREWLQVFVY